MIAIVLFSIVALTQSAMHGDIMMHVNDKASVYCVKECANPDDNPCGEGNGQASSCTSVTLSAGTTKHYLGCSLAVCESSCPEDVMTVTDDGTNCFKQDDIVFISQQVAELAAVARGCSGTHIMKDDIGDMHMIGTSHMACQGTYQASGGDGSMMGHEMTSSAALISSSSWASIFSFLLLTQIVGFLLIYK